MEHIFSAIQVQRFADAILKNGKQVLVHSIKQNSGLVPPFPIATKTELTTE